MPLRRKRLTVCGMIMTGICIATTVRFVAAQGPTPPIPPPPGVTPPPPGLPPAAAQDPLGNQLRPPPADVAAALKAVPQAAPAAGDDDLTKRQKERYQCACIESRARLEAFQAGTAQGTLELVLDCITKRLLPAELALSDQPADQLAAYQQALAILKWMELVNDTRVQAGRIPIQDLMQSRLKRLSIEIKVLEAKRTAQEPPTGRSSGQSNTPATPAAEQPKAAPAARPGPATLEQEIAERERMRAGALSPRSPLAEAVPTDTELQRLRKLRYQSAHAALADRLKAFNAAPAQRPIDSLLGCITQRLLPAELALSDRPADQLAAYQHALAALKWIEWVNDTLFQAGHFPIQDLEQTRFERLSMEIKLLEAKKAAGATPSK